MTNITVVQVLRKENAPYKSIISENSSFLENFGVEYLVYDNLSSFDVLKFIKDIPYAKYFRKEYKNAKTSLLESGLLSSGEKIIYLKSDDLLNINNVEVLENIRPHILKSDLKKLSMLKTENFKFDQFNLLFKEKKTLWEKIKLLFS